MKQNLKNLSGIILITALAAIAVTLSSAKRVEVTDECLNCICHAATECDTEIGCVGDACGAFGITWGFWSDGGERKPKGSKATGYKPCAEDLECSKKTARGYYNRYAKDCNNDKKIDCVDFARIYKLGPFACDQDRVEDTDFYDDFIECYNKTKTGVTNKDKPILCKA